MGQGVIKGICDLHQFLHKAQVRLTQGGSLIVRGLAHMRKYAVLQQLRRLLFANSPLHRYPTAIILCELT
jgi:hypothetical protein